MIAGVGTNTSFEARWQDPGLPAPTMLAGGPGKEGGTGWLLIRWEAADERERSSDAGRGLEVRR